MPTNLLRKVPEAFNRVTWTWVWYAWHLKFNRAFIVTNNIGSEVALHHFIRTWAENIWHWEKRWINNSLEKGQMRGININTIQHILSWIRFSFGAALDEIKVSEFLTLWIKDKVISKQSMPLLPIISLPLCTSSTAFKS